MRIRSILAAAWGLAAAGCMVPSPEVVAVPAGPDALACGELAVRGLGYETRRLEPGVVEANQVVPGVPGAADRHVVELAMDEGDDARLVATVTRWRYEPSSHSLPIRRQAVNQARPDRAEVEAVRRAVEGCAARR